MKPNKKDSLFINDTNNPEIYIADIYSIRDVGAKIKGSVSKVREKIGSGVEKIRSGTQTIKTKVHRASEIISEKKEGIRKNIIGKILAVNFPNE